jgi:hypothetical protein
MVHYIIYEVKRERVDFYKPVPDIKHYEQCELDEVPFEQFTPFTIKDIDTHFCIPDGVGA